MDRIRTVITENSVWKVDVLLSRYLRLPKYERPDPDALIPYTGEWEPYTALERVGDRIYIHRPVPIGHGAVRMTGSVEWDNLEPTDLAAPTDGATSGAHVSGDWP